MQKYQKPTEIVGGLRLHLNENTGCCSPAVLDALARLRPDQIGFYPPYESATLAVARYLRVDPDWLSLVNGLDEGIMATAVGYLRPTESGVRAEAIVPEPAFEILALDTEVAGGRVVRVPPAPDYAFQLPQVLDAITERTRIVFLTSPNNPTGIVTPHDAVCAVAARLPPGAIVFLDEAYAEFCGTSFLELLDDWPNVIVGRTFSKAFGLAGLRIGALAGHPAALEPVRLALPVYSVNVAATVAVQAALEDLDYVREYAAQVERSKLLLYAACERLQLRYWKSAANFVLIDAGARAGTLVRGAAMRGVHVRDRSGEPGLEGCLRVGAGLVEHTERCIQVFEEVLCAAA